MTAYYGNRTPVTSLENPDYISGTYTGETNISSRDGYISGRTPNGGITEQPEPNYPTTGGDNVTTESPLLSAIRDEWRAWWKEYYGTDYIPGNGQYGTAFMDHLKPIEAMPEVILQQILDVFRAREFVNREIGTYNFITFGNLFCRYVGEGMGVADAKSRAIAEIKVDPVLYAGYISGTVPNGTYPNAPGETETKRPMWPIILLLAVLAFFSRKRR